MATTKKTPRRESHFLGTGRRAFHPFDSDLADGHRGTPLSLGCGICRYKSGIDRGEYTFCINTKRVSIAIMESIRRKGDARQNAKKLIANTSGALGKISSGRFRKRWNPSRGRIRSTFISRVAYTHPSGEPRFITFSSPPVSSASLVPSGVAGGGSERGGASKILSPPHVPPR